MFFGKSFAKHLAKRLEKPLLYNHSIRQWWFCKIDFTLLAKQIRLIFQIFHLSLSFQKKPSISAQNTANDGLLEPYSSIHDYEEIPEDLITTTTITTTATTTEPTVPHINIPNDVCDYLIPKRTIRQVYNNATPEVLCNMQGDPRQQAGYLSMTL